MAKSCDSGFLILILDQLTKHKNVTKEALKPINISVN